MATERKDVFYISEEKEGKAKAHWIRIGVAFVNRDGSLNAYLDVLPRDGKIHIRDPKPFHKPKEEGT